MRHFSFRPALTMSGRRYKGLRGFAGKPFHPPLTDVPITAYLLAAAFDIGSIVARGSHPAVGRQLFLAGTWSLLGGAAVALLAALTGWADWHRSSEPGTQARRTVNAHAIVMLTVTGLVLVDLLARLLAYRDRTGTPAWIVALTIVAAALVTVGATLGGSLVYDYGFNVETAGDSPVWHHSEIDLLPGHKRAEVPAPAVPAAPAPSPAAEGSR